MDCPFVSFLITILDAQGNSIKDYTRQGRWLSADRTLELVGEGIVIDQLYIRIDTLLYSVLQTKTLYLRTDTLKYQIHPERNTIERLVVHLQPMNPMRDSAINSV